MLDIVPEHLKHIIVTVETHLDLNTILVEEVIGWLRAVEQRHHKAAPIADNQGRLLLTQEKWMVKMKIVDPPTRRGAPAVLVALAGINILKPHAGAPWQRQHSTGCRVR
jgi:hypothetical protein